MTVATNARNSGMIAASNIAKIFFDLNEESLTISHDIRRTIRRMEITVNPTSPLRAAIIDTAIDAAAEVNDEIDIIEPTTSVDWVGNT